MSSRRPTPRHTATRERRRKLPLPPLPQTHHHDHHRHRSHLILSYLIVSYLISSHVSHLILSFLLSYLMSLLQEIEYLSLSTSRAVLSRRAARATASLPRRVGYDVIDRAGRRSHGPSVGQASSIRQNCQNSSHSKHSLPLISTAIFSRSLARFPIYLVIPGY